MRPVPIGILAGVVIVAAAIFFSLRQPERTADARAVDTTQPVAAAGNLATPASEIFARALEASGVVLSAHGPTDVTLLGVAAAIEPGRFVTTCHGLAKGADLYVRVANMTHPAQVLAADYGDDVCLLQAGDSAPEARLRVAAGSLQAGDTIYALGANSAGELALTEGTVRGIHETATGRALELSMPVAPHGSGGPVFDAEGNMVGIATTQHGLGVGFDVAIPAGALAELRAMGQREAA